MMRYGCRNPRPPPVKENQNHRLRAGRTRTTAGKLRFSAAANNMFRTDPLKPCRSRLFQAFLLPLLFQPGCSQKNPAQSIRQMNAIRQAIEQQHKPELPRNKETPLAIVRSLPDGETTEKLEARLPQLFAAIGRMRRSELPQVYRALALLRDQPHIVDALVNHQRAQRAKAIEHRLIGLQVLGELQRPDALPFFKEVVWRSLPKSEGDPNIGEWISAREYEEMVQSSAINGLAYLRAPDGTPLPEAMRETLHVAKDHPSRAVRIAAIDAYMWNNGDSRAAAGVLYGELPRDLHMFVERPRFHRGANRAVFQARLEAWRAKWQR